MEYIKVVLSMVISYYLEALAFQIMYVTACEMPTFELIAAHTALSNSVMAIFVAGLGISHCIANSIIISKEENNLFIVRRKIWIGVILIISFSTFVAVELVNRKKAWLQFFTKN